MNELQRMHDTLDENSHKHAYGVSEDLKYGIRQAVERTAHQGDIGAFYGYVCTGADGKSDIRHG